MKSQQMKGFERGASRLVLAAVSLALVLAAPGLMADDSGSAARAVRLSSVDGKVQVSQGGEVIADAAVINTPLFEGSQVATGDDGRAEIQFEEGSVVRVSPNSSVTLSVLRPDDGVAGTEIRLDAGLAYFELQSGAQAGHIQVRFGDAVVTASGFTVLRIDMDNAPGVLAVFSGNAHLERGSGQSLDLHGGESLSLSASSPSESIEPDSWDSWNSDRDQVLTTEAASHTEATDSFVNNSNPAWHDLDSNGNWYNVPGQGYVWSPYDASSPGWDPWGNGYWMWTPRFGYVWVSGDSWGYMPFNCGMWSFYNGFGWGWAPGMGACMPWWGGGGGYWVPNLGFGPAGFRFPRVPHRPPNRNPSRPGGPSVPHPLLPVHNRPPSRGPAQPVRDRSVSVIIAGHVVMPLKPVSRPIYGPKAPTYGSHTMPTMPGGVRQPNGAGPGTRPVFTGGRTQQPTPRPMPSNPRMPAPSAPHMPAPTHSAPAPAPAPHGGGGGGGGGAPHGGGGGGGSPHH